jgi:uncharacterized membrane protein YhdT
VKQAPSKSILPTWFKVAIIGLVILVILFFILIIGVIAALRDDPARLEVVLEEVVSRALNRSVQS